MDDEKIVMTPSKEGKTTRIKIEKVKKNLMDASDVAHEAQGQHAGLVIKKQAQDAQDVNAKPDIQLEFKCFLVDQKTGKHVPESRVLKFWFAPETDYLDKVTGAYEFFKELVKPDQFPRDYVGFIKKVMKQMQQPRYNMMKKVDVDMCQLEPDEVVPSAEQVDASLGNNNYQYGLKKEDTRPKEVIVQERLLLTLESAYPNIMPVEDLSVMTEADQAMVQEALSILKGRNLIQEREPGKFVRQVLDDKTEVKDIKHMPVMGKGQKPTVAIITSKYNEKLAVDAMMEDKTTFVKYKTEGESNVYTIGYIGPHKVVTTKLPMIGRQMAAQISSGNTTTRLLGTFGDVEHVLLVGVAGGVPHYTDFYKHVRLGDIILSTPNDNRNLYIFCDKIKIDEEKGSMSYALKSWSPRDPVVLDVAKELIEAQKVDPSFSNQWKGYIQDGQQLLHAQQVDFSRPHPTTDKLYMNIGGSDVIEVGHPPVPDEVSSWYQPGQPMVRSGPIGAGRPVIKDDALRADFAARHQCVCFDTEFDQVLESIVGNRKDSFCFIRGVADYMDGSKNVEWQPYAALAAAAFTKAVLEKLPPVQP